MKKKVILGIIALLGIIQLFQIDKNVPEFSRNNDFLVRLNPEKALGETIKTACYDCHSYETEYPWYSNIAPISWWLKNHINEGREHLNFSEWTNYSKEIQQHKLEEIIEEIEEKEMPLASYTITHTNAKLKPEHRKLIIDWAKERLE